MEDEDYGLHNTKLHGGYMFDYYNELYYIEDSFSSEKPTQSTKLRKFKTTVHKKQVRVRKQTRFIKDDYETDN